MDSNETHIVFDGEQMVARLGEPVSMALIRHGEMIFERSVKYHRPHGAFCLSGSCFGCKVRVDGLPNRLACQTPVEPGMHLERQNAFPSADFDVMKIADWFFPEGMDVQSMFTQNRALNTAFTHAVWHMAAGGKFPSPSATSPSLPQERLHSTLIVGGGEAGLAAASALSDSKTVFSLAERDPWSASQISGALRQEIVAAYDLEHLLGSDGTALYRHRTQALVLATGTYCRNALFANNDLPGIFSDRALTRATAFGTRLGGLAVIATESADPSRYEILKRLCTQNGMEVQDCISVGNLLEAKGSRRVKGVVTADGRHIRCDTLIVDRPGTPAFELSQQLGCTLVLDSETMGFRPVVDSNSETSVNNVYWLSAAHEDLPERARALADRISQRAMHP